MPLAGYQFEVPTTGYTAELTAGQISLDHEADVSLLGEVSARLAHSEKLADEVIQDVAAGAVVWIVGGTIELPLFDYKTSETAYGLVQVSSPIPFSKRVTGNAPDCQIDRALGIGSRFEDIGEHAVAAGKYAALQSFALDSRFRDVPTDSFNTGFRPPAGKILGPLYKGVRRGREMVRRGREDYVTVEDYLSLMENKDPWLKSITPVSAKPKAESLTGEQS